MRTDQSTDNTKVPFCKLNEVLFFFFGGEGLLTGTEVTQGQRHQQCLLMHPQKLKHGVYGTSCRPLNKVETFPRRDFSWSQSFSGSSVRRCFQVARFG